MKRGLVVVIGALVVVAGAWYGLHWGSAPQPAAAVSEARTPVERVTPDKSWADLFDTLDKQWNDAGKKNVQAIGPMAGTPSTKNNK
jgi:hypothetical protein